MLKRGSILSKVTTILYIDPGGARDDLSTRTGWAEGSIVWALLAGVIAIVAMIIHGL